MSERIYGVAMEDSRPLPDGKHHECWVLVGGHFTTNADLIRGIDEAIKRSSDASTEYNLRKDREQIRDAVNAQHAALVARDEAAPAPLSQRVGAGDFVADVRTFRLWQVMHIDRESERALLARCDGTEKLVDLAYLDRLFIGYHSTGQNTADATAADVRSVQSAQPLSQRIKPGDVLEVRTAAGWMRFTVVGRRYNNWVLRDAQGLVDEWRLDGSGDDWRLVESAPMPVVETMIVPHEQAQAAREYLGAKYGVPHSERYTESPPADALNRWEARRHNAHCTRCYGPAFHGAGALRCERAGGCLAEREPKVDAIDASADLRDAAPDADVWEMSARENYWLADGCDGRYATRELAVAAWRDAVIARAKREAGL